MREFLRPRFVGTVAKGRVAAGEVAVRRGDEQKPPLFAEAEAGDDFAVPVYVAVVEIAELAPPLANELEETTTRVVIVLVRLQVGGEVLDAFREDRHLDLRGAGIRRVDGVVPYQFGFALFSQQPSLRSSFAYR
jgi:hypothetical protein